MLEHPNLGGRPTKLTQELLDKAKSYLETCVDIPIEKDNGHISYVQVNLPKVVSLARFLEINKDTVYEWCKEYEGDNEETEYLRQEFSVIVKEVEEAQEERLINNALGGLYQAKTANMMLSKHGYSEKRETDITSNGQTIQIQVPAEIADKNGLL